MIGIIITLIPMLPVQSLIALMLALFFRANIPVAVCLQFISIPPTAVIHLPACFLTGCWALGKSPSDYLPATGDLFTAEMVGAILGRGLAPLYVGAITLGLILGPVGYFLIRWFWVDRPARKLRARVLGSTLPHDTPTQE